jgi:hypothetical protein
MIAHILALQIAACSSCVIHVDTLLQIRDPDGRGGLSTPSGIARTRDGNWLVTSFENPGQISVFSPTGRALRTVGRSGEGPGEYRSATLVTVGPADSVWVFDSQLMRVSVLDASLNYSRSYRVVTRPVLDLTVFPDSRLLVSAEYRTGERAGFPLHVVEPDGRVTISLGTETPAYRSEEDTYLNRRSFWPADRSAVWTADIVRYRLQQWSLEGRKLKEINRNVDWFRPHTTYPYPSDISSQPPPPGLVSVHQDSSGLLWTLIRVPDPRWRSAVGPRRNSAGRNSIGVLQRSRYWDTVVEAIDPLTGTLVASYRLDAVLNRFVANRMAFQYEEDEVGEPRIVIWRFQVIESNRRQ